jgi:hypothetical protein
VDDDKPDEIMTDKQIQQVSEQIDAFCDAVTPMPADLFSTALTRFMAYCIASVPMEEQYLEGVYAAVLAQLREEVPAFREQNQMLRGQDGGEVDGM